LGNEGESVEIYTTIIEPESTLFQESFLEFEECTGITIEWNGDQAFEEQIAVRVAGGTAPDLAIFPQPGLLASFAGDLVPASDAVESSVDSELHRGLEELRNRRRHLLRCTRWAQT
jgi:alpha-glucoside transport system substrate-binding protein